MKALRVAHKLSRGVEIFLVVAASSLAVAVAGGLVSPNNVTQILSPGVYAPGLGLVLERGALTVGQWRSYLAIVGLPSLATFLLGWVAVNKISKTLQDSVEGRAFTVDNARRIRVAGFAVLWAAAAEAVRTIGFGIFFTRTILTLADYKLPFEWGPFNGIQFKGDLGIRTGVLALLILAIAEVFAHGVRLQEDHDLTV